MTSGKDTENSIHGTDVQDVAGLVDESALPSVVKKGSLQATEVAEYLRRHTDFFIHYPDLLAELTIPHEYGDNAVSLIEHQVRLLRQQLHANRNRLHNLFSIARANEDIHMRLHALTLALFDHKNIDIFCSCLYAELSKSFQTEQICLRIFLPKQNMPAEQRAEFVSREDQNVQLFADLLENKQVQTGLLSRQQLEYLFPGDTMIASAAVLPLGDVADIKWCWSGILAIGSTDAMRFHSGMAVELLLRFAEMLSLLLRTHIAE